MGWNPDLNAYVPEPGDCPECGMRPGECYLICSRHPDHYSAEQERADSERNDAMSYEELVVATAADYRRRGEPDPWGIYDPADDECEGHPAGPFDPMGETVYCDGTCRTRS
jgi:hypothetical protein